ncbi:Uma2 family endonuclease [Streptomyces sp. NPDC021096]|uniref:Uma2 family endonuclease n=1 Tax=Streptomyces sp. NPDC021096 TaxID=3154792 RepID=UPI003403F1FF
MGAVMAAEARYQQPERATPENWMYPPADGWTYDQVKELVLPCDWELLGGKIVVRGETRWWHNRVRNRLYTRIDDLLQEPYTVEAEQALFVDKRNAPRPDVLVFDKTGLDVGTVDCIPVENAVLAIEVVSPGSVSEDRLYKPTIYASVGIDYYWRVERGPDIAPEVHEFWRDAEAGLFVPSPERRTHVGTLKTTVPFPIEIDLRNLIKI